MNTLRLKNNQSKNFTFVLLFAFIFQAAAQNSQRPVPESWNIASIEKVAAIEPEKPNLAPLKVEDAVNELDKSVSWGFGTTNATQLKSWLDPVGTNPTTLQQSPITQAFSFDAAISVLNIPTDLCDATITPTLRITNAGSTALTSATITHQLDTDTPVVINWTGNLAMDAFEDIPLTAIAVSGAGAHSFAASVANPNGNVDESPSNDTSTKNFSIPDSFEVTTIRVIITPDRYGAETTWQLTNSNGGIVANGGPYTTIGTNGTQPDEITDVPITILDECYTFIINDSYGDGICCLYGAGDYRLEDVAGNILINGNGSFGPSASHLFKVTSAVTCTDPDVPSAISATPSTICSSANSTLTWTGNLNDATAWHIYTGSCGSTLVGTSSTNSFTTGPLTANTTFYIRGEDAAGCVDESTGLCGSVTVPVNATPSTPTISTTDELCLGNNDGEINVAAVLFLQDFENASGTYTSSTSTIAGTQNLSYETATNPAQGRLTFRNDFVRTGSSGSVIASLDNPLGLSTNRLSQVIDLSAQVGDTDIKLDFWWYDHGDEGDSADIVEIRGNSASPWIQIYSFAVNSNNGNWTYANFDLDNLLTSNGQSFSSTFEIRFNQTDNFPINTDGISIDDIAVFKENTNYSFSWSNGSSNATQEIAGSFYSSTISNLSPGNYSVTITANQGCSTTVNTTIASGTSDDATFNYSAAAYCFNDPDPTPTITGLTGGAFSSTAGLSIDPSTGSIEVSASTPGTYTVTYTTAGTCPNSSNVSVTINGLDDASFSYSAAAYCPNDADPTPTVTGLTGGTFTSTAGLSINAGTGVIDLSTTTQGTYTITYTTNGPCVNTDSFVITIEDNIAPVPDVVTLADVTAECEITILTAPTATDNCAGTVTATSDVTLPITAQETILVTWTYDDGNGNTSTQTQNVTIDDVTAPVPDVVTLADLFFNCEVDALTPPTSIDNCVGTIVGTTQTAFPITSSTLVTWVFDDGNGNISTQNQQINVNYRTIDPITDVTICDSFILPAITGNNLTGTELYYTISGGNGLAFAEADTINFADFATYPVTLYAYGQDADGCGDEVAFQLTLNESPIVAAIPDVTICDQYVLPALSVGNYYTLPNGNGTLIADGTVLTSSQNLYVYAEDVSNNCSDEESFVLTINQSDILGASFASQTYTYDGTTKSLAVTNIPATATVVYTNNNQVDAGSYQVTATITSADANCNSIVLNATLTIDRSPQTITFDPLVRRRLSVDPDFQLMASSTSGLPIDYDFSFTGATPAATVSTAGFVTLEAEGDILISAQQSGNNNYLPATTVQQPLEVYLGANADLNAVIIEGEVINNPDDDIFFLIDCESGADSVSVELENSDRATFNPGATFTIATPRPGIYIQEVIVTADNGRDSRTYTITVERRFAFDAIVEMKYNNTLVVNNNFDENGGYNFVAYEWFKNGRNVGTEQFFSEGNNASDRLDPTASYYVRITTVQGEVLQTCISTVDLGSTFSLTILQNPVLEGHQLLVRADYPVEELENAVYQLYTSSGQFLMSVPAQGMDSQITLLNGLPVGLYRLVLVTSNRKVVENFIKN